MQRDLFKQKYGAAAPRFGSLQPPTSSQTSNPPLQSPTSSQPSNPDTFLPSSWSNYFTSQLQVDVPQLRNGVQIINKFQTYLGGTSNEPVFLFLHGGGHSALSWALTVKEMQNEGKMVCYDCRGHGKTFTDNDEDLSAETLAQDCIDFVNVFLKDAKHLILVGHSMGGAIAARVAAKSVISNLVALVVIDVVEGTALASLPHMHQVLQSRPQSFESLEKAILWSVESGTLHKLESAKVSIPPQLIEKDGKYVWRTDLFKSEQYWEGWFKDLSKIFLSAKALKVLILAGTDRLDVDLTAAQMQGKYQLVLLPKCGHVIQEDDPKQVALALTRFKQRFKF